MSDAFPIVHTFEGGPSADASTLLIRATGFDASVTTFAIPVDNVKHFIAFLLAWVGTISEATGDADALVSRFRSSQAFAANSERTSESKRTLAIYDSSAAFGARSSQPHRPRNRANFGFAALGEAQLMPIPATSVAVGAPSGQEGYLGISVGRAEPSWCSPCRWRRSGRSGRH